MGPVTKGFIASITTAISVGPVIPWIEFHSLRLEVLW